MAYRKSIELFLVNGDPDSLITAELSNWNGKAIRIPRTEVKDCSRDDIRNAGVYFLFCKGNAEERDSVYIGEAENVYERLCQHIRDYQSGRESYYWITAVVFIGHDLNKAHIRYLENCFVQMAKESNQYTVLTKNTYSKTALKESQIAIMEEYIDNVRLLINTFGYRVFVQANSKKEERAALICKSTAGNASARGIVSENGFTVFKGSRVSDHTVPSFQAHGIGYFKLRARLEKEGTIVDNVFQADYEFASPSAAASVVLGRMANGNVEWVTETGVKLKDIE